MVEIVPLTEREKKQQPFQLYLALLERQRLAALRMADEMAVEYLLMQWKEER